MRASYHGCEILQVTPAQCLECGARWVFSVLVADPRGESPRAFHTCDRGLLPGQYFPHECWRCSTRDVACTQADERLSAPR